MSDAEWLPARDARAKLKEKSDRPEMQLIACASLPNVKTRATIWMRDGQTVQKNAPLRYQFWEAVAADGAQDWQLGVFEHSSTDRSGHFEHAEFLNWKAVGVEFYWPDIVVQLGLNDGPATAVSETTLPSLPRGQLPTTAKPNDHKYEKAAHAAAEIIRDTRVSRAEAIRRVSVDYYSRMLHDDSVHRAIRHVFDLMYDRDGMPVQD